MVGGIDRCWMFASTALAVLALRLSAAEVQPEVAPTTYHVTRYTTEQGLPHNDIRALLQTRDGYLWVGTLAGLARFDGVKFKVFDMSNTPEMTHYAINKQGSTHIFLRFLFRPPPAVSSSCLLFFAAIGFGSSAW
jgi:hypothetical protein